MAKIKSFGFVKATTPCSECGNPLQINGPFNMHLCNYCLSEVEISNELILDIVEQIRDAARQNRDFKKHTLLIISGHHIQLIRGRGLPICRSCGAELKGELFDFDDKSNDWSTSCPECDFEIPVQRVPGFVRHKYKGAHVIINAMSGAPDGEPEKPAIEGIIFTCPGCGGALKIDGMERIVNCNFCRGNVYLPDDLWLRLHPVKKIQQWWIGFR